MPGLLQRSEASQSPASEALESRGGSRAVAESLFVQPWEACQGENIFADINTHTLKASFIVRLAGAPARIVAKSWRSGIFALDVLSFRWKALSHEVVTLAGQLAEKD